MRNYIQLVGHLGQDPELTSFDNGGTKARISVATNRRYKSRDGEPVEETTWHRVIGYGTTAEIMRDKLARGKRVLVEGRMEYRSYENKEGQKVQTSEVVAQRVLAL